MATKTEQDDESGASTQDTIAANSSSSAEDPPAPTTTTSTLLDDIFLTTPRSPSPSPLPRLRSTHHTAGYLAGLTLGKSTQMQQGFDEGYAAGAALGLEAGWVLGVLAGLGRGAEMGEAEVELGEVERVREKVGRWKGRVEECARGVGVDLGGLEERGERREEEGRGSG
ncbi:MAG: Essential protein Yae1, N terminal [Trichoglossum hirsutum]|nr:MAG: Essential protein Yae1, N terminal [Trichoglossum hirsutum]